MDNKFDDKLAFWYLHKYGRYERYIIVLSNIALFQTAYNDLRDFFISKQKGGLFPTNVVVLEGYRANKVPHESTFINVPNEIPLNGEFYEYLEREPLSGTIDILQSAPTPKWHIMKVASLENTTIRRYHCIHGYNSNQKSSSAKEADNQATMDWLQNLQMYIRSKHPGAQIRFTNNFASFTGSGASQPYNSLKHFVPEKHLEAALQDPFVYRQLEMSLKIINNADGGLNAIALVPEGCPHSLAELTLIARKNVAPEAAKYRKHFINIIDNQLGPALLKVENNLELSLKQNHSPSLADAYADVKGRKARVMGAVRKAFDSDLSVETCDANHVVAAMAIDGTFANTLPTELLERFPKKWQPMSFVYNEEKTIVFGKCGESKEHGQTVSGLDSADILRVLELLAQL